MSTLKKDILKFTEEQEVKYASAKQIRGTGYLAYRDLENFSLLQNANVTNVLDLGCGAGRSTLFLSSFCKSIEGTDISNNMLDNAKVLLPSTKFYLNNFENASYSSSLYSTIYSILMFFHFQTVEQISRELNKCFCSLSPQGSLIIVNGTSNLYEKDYTSVKGEGKVPENDGDFCRVYLKNIDCIVSDYFWSKELIIQKAVECGFVFTGCHLPLGKKEDGQDYKEEYKYSPYYYLAFKKI